MSSVLVETEEFCAVWLLGAAARLPEAGEETKWGMWVLGAEEEEEGGRQDEGLLVQDTHVGRITAVINNIQADKGSLKQGGDKKWEEGIKTSSRDQMQQE